MTEAEWLASEDPLAILRHLTYGGMESGRREAEGLPLLISDRKLRLWTVACCHQVAGGLVAETSLRCLDVAEAYADDVAPPEQPRTVALASQVGRGGGGPDEACRWTCYTHDMNMAAELVCTQTSRYVPPAIQAALLRDIVGNPFYLVTLQKCGRCDGDGKAHGSDRPFEWTPEVGYPGPCPVCHGCGHVYGTPTVLALAQNAYGERGRECEACDGRGYFHPNLVQSRGCPDCRGTGRIEDGTLDPDRLVVLADALEEVDCTDQIMLGHLRGLEAVHTSQGGRYFRSLRGPHVRGCHVLDCILGLE